MRGIDMYSIARRIDVSVQYGGSTEATIMHYFCAVLGGGGGLF